MKSYGGPKYGQKFDEKDYEILGREIKNRRLSVDKDVIEVYNLLTPEGFIEFMNKGA
jgi:hypothetical protein